MISDIFFSSGAEPLEKKINGRDIGRAILDYSFNTVIASNVDCEQPILNVSNRRVAFR